MKGATLALALLLAAACGGEEPPAPVEPTPSKPPVTPTRDPEPDPEPAPTGDLRGDAAAGGPLYQLYCATCHGPGGKGDGPAAPKDPVPADHSDAAYMGKLSDAHLYQVIDKGGASIGKSPLMAPWGGVLNDEQIRDLIAYVRTLSGT